ncbi:MAG: alpha/beta hydrolase [Bacteroidota bacterium]
MLRFVLTLLLGGFATSVGQAQTLDTLIDLGTHQLHFKIISGQGTPIVFESGNNNDGTVWEPLLDSLHQVTGATLITYDRAGLGQSSIDTTSISFRKEASDLNRVLLQLGYEEALFFVCHSFGGFYTTQYAIQQEQHIKGAVFIDPALPCFFTKAWASDFIQSISKEDWAAMKNYYQGLYYVLQDFPGICSSMQDQTMPESIPVTLIAAEQILPMVQPDEVEQWTNCLETFGTAPNHRYVLAKDCGHKVWADNPSLVLKEIIRLYNDVHHQD